MSSVLAGSAESPLLSSHWRAISKPSMAERVVALVVADTA